LQNLGLILCAKIETDANNINKNIKIVISDRILGIVPSRYCRVNGSRMPPIGFSGGNAGLERPSHVTDS
jgi:hypothetical protein